MENKLKILRFKKGLYRKYCSITKDNSELEHSMAQRKMTRNMHLAKKSDICIHPDGQLYQYGKLWFVIDEDNHEIVWLENYMPEPKNWRFKSKKYKQLSSQLGIS